MDSFKRAGKHGGSGRQTGKVGKGLLGTVPENGQMPEGPGEDPTVLPKKQKAKKPNLDPGPNLPVKWKKRTGKGC